MGREKLTAEEQKQLLRVAREAIVEHLRDEKTSKAGAPSERLTERCGTFVSLHKHGDLRGCIGTMTGRRPLIDSIREMAVSASIRDPRFPPVTEAELVDIDLEISVLGPLGQIDDVSEIDVGRHGILITRELYSGLLLPQVATQYGWDRETFLEQTCIKAGLPSDGWKDPKTQIETFEAQVFGEQDFR